MDHARRRLPRIVASLGSLAIALAACSQGIPSAGSAGPSAFSSLPSSSAAAAPPVGLEGGWLKFTRFDEGSHTFQSDHLIHPDGSGEADLPVPGTEGGARFSHDGKHLAVITVHDDDRVGTAIIQPDGTVERVLDLPEGHLNLACLVWSPDDERLACEGFSDNPSDSGVYSVRASDGGDVVRLTHARNGENDAPGDYSPDGTQLLFARGAEGGPLFLLDLSGEIRKPQTMPGIYEDAGRFSLDGQSILTSSGGTLFVLDLDGKPLFTIRETGAYLFNAVWSPSGEWIAYSRAVSGPHADIFISRPDGSERWQVTSTPDNEIGVEWGR